MEHVACLKKLSTVTTFTKKTFEFQSAPLTFAQNFTDLFIYITDTYVERW